MGQRDLRSLNIIQHMLRAGFGIVIILRSGSDLHQQSGSHGNNSGPGQNDEIRIYNTGLATLHVEQHELKESETRRHKLHKEQNVTRNGKCT